MKKLISVLSTIALTSTSITSVVSCSVPSAQVNVRINGSDEDISDFNGNLQSHLVPMAAYQLLNAITYTDTKYQDPEKRAQFRAILGERGIQLSLDDIFDNISEQTEDEKQFWASYRAARNTRFTDISINTEDSGIGTYKIGDIFPYTQEIVVDSNKPNDERTTYGQITLANKTLNEFAEAEDTKERLSSLDFDDISMLGLDASTFTNAAPTLLQASNSDEDQLVKQEVTNEFELRVNENNIVSSNVFYYSNAVLSDININFTDPGAGSDEERSFEINYSNFTGMIVRWQLGVATISTKTSDGITTSEVIYWFEPVRYQFTVKPIDNETTKDLFDNINEDFKVDFLRV